MSVGEGLGGGGVGEIKKKQKKKQDPGHSFATPTSHKQ